MNKKILDKYPQPKYLPDEIVIVDMDKHPGRKENMEHDKLLVTKINEGVFSAGKDDCGWIYWVGQGAAVPECCIVGRVTPQKPAIALMKPRVKPEFL